GDAIASDAGWVNMMQRGDAMRAWGNVMRESGAFAAARDLYATAAAMYEQNSAPQGTIAATYNQLATAQSQVGDLEGAVSSLLRAVALTPDQPDLQLALGRALLASDATRLDEARAAFDTALAAEPADANYAKVVLEAWQSVGADAEMAAVCQRLPAEAKNEAVLTLCQR
ncbi:MAG: tetratricopeptide repeat protein, partial [Ardenticatenales bacterium]|nr:tetratricopeptide repeat protein [Ardenticatenales bacterium]